MHYLFNETTEYWHYVAISYVRQHEHQTYVYLYIDNVLFLETSILDWFTYTYNSATYYLHIAKNFPGIVRKAKINSRPYCLNSKSLWVNTDQTKCNLKGTYDCSFCDTDEEVGSTGYYNCFVTCADFGYYYSNSNCKKCFNSCRYCYNSDSSSNCYMCNGTSYWT